MDNKEDKYLATIEQVIEHFGTIQRNFVLDKTGVRAIIVFIEQFEGRRPYFELNDPVVEKGKAAAYRVIKELSGQLDFLMKLECPDNWKKFHGKLVESLEIQLEGYKEMVKVFEDSRLEHIESGHNLVNKGVGILQCGNRSEKL